jgi:hypothetical protein
MGSKRINLNRVTNCFTLVASYSRKAPGGGKPTSRQVKGVYLLPLIEKLAEFSVTVVPFRASTGEIHIIGKLRCYFGTTKYKGKFSFVETEKFSYKLISFGRCSARSYMERTRFLLLFFLILFWSLFYLVKVEAGIV